MEQKDQRNKEQMPAVAAEEVCDTEQALLTMRLLERGTRQAFLDGELGVEEAKTRLD